MADKFFDTVENMVGLFEAMHTNKVVASAYPLNTGVKSKPPSIAKYANPEYVNIFKKILQTRKIISAKGSGKDSAINDYVKSHVLRLIAHKLDRLSDQIEKCSEKTSSKFLLKSKMMTYHESWKTILKEICNYFIYDLKVDHEEGIKHQTWFWNVYFHSKVLQEMQLIKGPKTTAAMPSGRYSHLTPALPPV
jgi:hypothetical protein